MRTERNSIAKKCTSVNDFKEDQHFASKLIKDATGYLVRLNVMQTLQN